MGAGLFGMREFLRRLVAIADSSRSTLAWECAYNFFAPFPISCFGIGHSASPSIFFSLLSFARSLCEWGASFSGGRSRPHWYAPTQAIDAKPNPT